ncbi:MAG: FAD-dependent oxidoreductase [Elusimicrobia bacterium]|nr:FAD-dependent oxidoreductase [Elusimicrobiota bacterium]
MKVKNLIIGAGVTGLSAAYHLQKLGKKDFAVLERAAGPGGLCASVAYKNFCFDYGGHIVHTRNSYTRELLKKLLGKNAAIAKRKAWVYLQDTFVPFPFQANLAYLKPEIVEECVTALVAAKKRGKKNFENFADYALSSYGEGIYKYFMRPYNEKLWRVKVEDLSCAWCADFVPQTDMEDIVKGAYFKTRASYGYNAHFIYPKTGGIGALTRALAAETENIFYDTEVKKIDTVKKTAFTNNGIFEYENLINTSPLKTFVAACAGLEKNIYALAQKLKNNKVYVLNLGINRAVENISWVYFPEAQFKFYRAGVQSSFSPAVAPEGCGALYIEISAAANSKKPNFNKLQKEIITALKDARILKQEDKILAALWLGINPAYVTYDAARETVVPQIIAALKEKNIYCAGRYGAWEYSFIEKNILDAKCLAQKL